MITLQNIIIVETDEHEKEGSFQEHDYLHCVKCLALKTMVQ